MTRAAREETAPPAGYEVIRAEGRYFPVRLHLHDTIHPGATAFTQPDGSIVSFAKRTSAILYLYRASVGTTPPIVSPPPESAAHT